MRPEELSSFVGRTAEIGELRALLDAARAVTLCGVGGIGKSRLALRLLAAVAADYPDGAWFVELADLRQPEHVVTQVAAVLGIDEEPGRLLLDTLADSLRHRRAILVLDNCEHLIEACASVCRRLLASSPKLQVVATSREPLRVAGETAWQVPPLALPPAELAAELTGTEVSGADLVRWRDCESVRLFADRAAAVAPAFALTAATLPAVTGICRALDGMPLAIELAAAWARVLSADQIAARLDRRLSLLTSTDRGVPARQQTLRATLDWSYGLLSESEQVLLRRLSALAGWSLDMAEQVCADDVLAADDVMAAADVLDLLAGLADKSLVEVEPDAPGEARYRMLETVREYAAGQLELAGETAALQLRRRAYVLDLVERFFAIGMAIEPAPWSARVGVFRRYDLDVANVRELLSGCLAEGDAATGLRICTATAPVWLVRGTSAEGAGWIDSLLALPAAAAVPDSVRGPALVTQAQLALAAGSGTAAQLAAAGRELCVAAGRQYWVAAALNLQTEVALRAGHLDDAAARAGDALAVARDAGDRWNEGFALGTLAVVAGTRGDLAGAQQLGEEALAVMRAIDQQWGAARTLLGLADLARLMADPGLARERYLAALVILREVSARPLIARCLAGLGRLAIDQADLPAARGHLTESLRLSYASGSRAGIARGLEDTAWLLVQEGDPGAGLQLAAVVTALRAEASLPAMSEARTRRLTDAAAVDEQEAARLWAAGLAMTPAGAMSLALGEPAPGPAQAGLGTGTTTGLTPRESEVAALIAAGASNREIAAELVISPATAARHVANILAKLGFSSRSQIAAWLAGGGPQS